MSTRFGPLPLRGRPRAGESPRVPAMKEYHDTIVSLQGELQEAANDINRLTAENQALKEDNELEKMEQRALCAEKSLVAYRKQNKRDALIQASLEAELKDAQEQICTAIREKLESKRVFERMLLEQKESHEKTVDACVEERVEERAKEMHAEFSEAFENGKKVIHENAQKDIEMLDEREEELKGKEEELDGIDKYLKKRAKKLAKIKQDLEKREAEFVELVNENRQVMETSSKAKDDALMELHSIRRELEKSRAREARMEERLAQLQKEGGGDEDDDVQYEDQLEILANVAAAAEAEDNRAALEGKTYSELNAMDPLVLYDLIPKKEGQKYSDNPDSKKKLVKRYLKRRVENGTIDSFENGDFLGELERAAENCIQDAVDLVKGPRVQVYWNVQKAKPFSGKPSSARMTLLDEDKVNISLLDNAKFQTTLNNVEWHIYVDGTPWLAVKKSTIKGAGLGVFALRPFKKREMIAFYGAENMAFKTHDSKSRLNNDKTIYDDHGARYVPDAHTMYMGLQFANDATFGNATATTKAATNSEMDGKLRLWSEADIDTGDELFFEYKWKNGEKNWSKKKNTGIIPTSTKRSRSETPSPPPDSPTNPVQKDTGGPTHAGSPTSPVQKLRRRGQDPSPNKLAANTVQAAAAPNAPAVAANSVAPSAPAQQHAPAGPPAQQHVPPVANTVPAAVANSVQPNAPVQQLFTMGPPAQQQFSMGPPAQQHFPMGPPAQQHFPPNGPPPLWPLAPPLGPPSGVYGPPYASYAPPYHLQGYAPPLLTPLGSRKPRQPRQLLLRLRRLQRVQMGQATTRRRHKT